MENEDAKQLLLDRSCNNCRYKCIINSTCLKTEKERPGSNVCLSWEHGDINQQYVENMKRPELYDKLKEASEAIAGDFVKVMGEYTIDMSKNLDDLHDELFSLTTKIRRGIK